MIEAMIMAGGRSERMRVRGFAEHKALVPVLGVSLAERNVLALLRHGFRSVAIAISEREDDLRVFAERRLAPLVAAGGGSLQVLVEERPRGTIGAIGDVAASDALLVVNVDNLTALDLRDLVAFHRRTGGAMSIASHIERMQMPFGRLRVDAEEVVAYEEKPNYAIRISSGTCVVGPPAIALVTPSEAIGVPELFARLHERGLSVACYRHDAPWIDVNDPDAVVRAEQLLRRIPVLAAP